MNQEQFEDLEQNEDFLEEEEGIDLEENDSEDHGEEESPEEEKSDAKQNDADDQDPAMAFEVERIKKNLKENDKLRRMTYAQAEKIRQMEAENLQLKNLAGQTFEDNVIHSGVRLEEDMQKAKAEAAIAMKENDTYAIVEAQAKIAKIAADISNFERWKEGYQGQQEAAADHNAALEPQLDLERQQGIVEWIHTQPDLNENSPYYNPQLTYIMGNIASNIDAELWQQGNQHLIGTSDYFDLFDKVVDEQRKIINSQNSQGNFGMNSPQRLVQTVNRGRPEVKSKGYSHPVTRGNISGSGEGGAKTVRLTSEEVDFAKSIGVSPKSFLKSKIQDMQRKVY